MALTATSRRRYEGRVALVTGGGRGLGRAIAHGLAAEGAAVGVLARTREEVTVVVDELMSGYDVVAMAFAGDIRRSTDIAASVAELERSAGPVDVLMNCAGVFAAGPSDDLDLHSVRELIDINVTGTLIACSILGESMLRRKRGSIVNMASLLSFVAFPERAAYAASKGGVLQMTRVLGVEWARRGVNVNAIAPGMISVETPHPVVQTGELSEKQIVHRIPAGRRGRPADVVGPALFLASDEARYINGATLVVDGGWLANGYV